MAMTFVGETVTVHRYTTDRYGDRTETTTFEVHSCAFAPRISTEDTDRAEQVQAEAELYTPWGQDIRAYDVIERDDTTRWEVQGVRENWSYPWTGSWQPGTVVLLKRVTG